MEERDEEMFIEAIAQSLRDEPMRRVSPSFDARVMASIRWSERPSGIAAFTGWLMRPRRLSISPLGGLAAAAAFALVAYLGAAATVRTITREMLATQSGSASTALAVADSSSPQLVQFVFIAPDARSVSLVGDFNDWSSTATPMSSASGNVWTVQVPLTPGRYNYIFMVDGNKMVADPKAPAAPPDDFGQRNSVVTVGGAAS